MSDAVVNGKAFRSKLDGQLIQTLLPLEDHQAVVHYPFFANTFPLAFHYACLLRGKAASNNLINDRINLVAWGDELGLLGKDHPRPIICYSVAAQSKINVIPVDVTIFQPHWVFSEFNLRVWAERKRASETVRRESPDAEFSDVAKVLSNYFEYFEIFTEIPDQAEALFHQLLDGGNGGSNFKVIVGNNAQLLFDEDHLTHNTLRLFLYGAPLTTYFLRKPQRYIPFRVGNLEGAEKFFKTVVAIKGGSEEAQKCIAAALDKYHKELYVGAEREMKNDQQSFRAVQYGYNRVARLLQHRSSFASSQEYAKCLHKHHKSPDDGPNHSKSAS